MPRAHVALAPLVLVVACTEDAPRYELEGLTVLTEDFTEVCSDSFSYFERRLAWLVLETGLRAEPAGLDFHWYLNGAPTKKCSTGTGNCSVGRSIYGEWVSFSHELVHAHLSRLGRTRVWLEEGMAVMLEDEWAGAVDASQTPSEMMQIEDALELDYWNAGGFTNYLRDRYGMAQLLDYYEASAGASAEGAVDIFGDVFGESFADVEAEYLGLDVLPRTGSPTCDALEVAWTGESWEHDFILACDEAGSLGPQQSWSDGDADKGPGLFSTVTMTIPRGAVTFELASTEPVWITISGCDQPEWVYLSPDELQAGADLLGGKYVVSVQSYLDPVATAKLTARRVPASGVMGRSKIVTQPLGPLRNHTHPCKARHAAQGVTSGAADL